MNYSGRYPGLFGGATQGRRRSDKPIEVPPPPVEDPIPDPPSLIETDPVVGIDPGLVLAVDVLAVEDLAQKLADDHTVAELKAIANDLQIEYKSGVRELVLATLIAEHQLKEAQDGTS